MLAVRGDVDGMGEQLCLVACDSGETSNPDFVRAIQVMVLGDGGMSSDHELRFAIRLMREMGGRTRGEACDPIAPANGGVIAQIDGVQVNGHREVVDARVRAKAQMFGIDPRESNPRRGGKFVTEQALQKEAAQRPRKQKQDGF